MHAVPRGWTQFLTRLRLLPDAERCESPNTLPLAGREEPPLLGRALAATRGLSVRSKTCTFSAATACGPCEEKRLTQLL